MSAHCGAMAPECDIKVSRVKVCCYSKERSKDDFLIAALCKVPGGRALCQTHKIIGTSWQSACLSALTKCLTTCLSLSKCVHACIWQSVCMPAVTKCCPGKVLWQSALTKCMPLQNAAFAKWCLDKVSLQSALTKCVPWQSALVKCRISLSLVPEKT